MTGRESWPHSDGVVTIRPPAPGEDRLLNAGRDAEWERWLGPGSDHLEPTAVILAGDELVGWVDADPSPGWLKPGEVNLGYLVLRAHRRRGYALRALRLFLEHLSEHTASTTASLVIDPANVASLGVARALGAEALGTFSGGGHEAIRFVVDVGHPGGGGLRSDG